jgi:hypothetical protein
VLAEVVKELTAFVEGTRQFITVCRQDLWHARLLWWGVVQPHAHLPRWEPPPVSCPPLLIQYLPYDNFVRNEREEVKDKFETSRVSPVSSSF